jgi:phage virion morphogenesis protein
MGDVIRINVAGTIRDLNRVRAVLQNPKPYLVMIANELGRVSRQAFEKESSPEGAKWAPLSPRYSAWKIKKMPGRGILRAKGQLVRTIFTGTTERTAYISTANLPHAAIHQYGFMGSVTVQAHIRPAHMRRKPGGKRKSISVKAHPVSAFSRFVRIPARPYVGFPPASEKRIVQDIEQDLIAKSGGLK